MIVFQKFASVLIVPVLFCFYIFDKIFWCFCLLSFDILINEIKLKKLHCIITFDDFVKHSYNIRDFLTEFQSR